MLATSPGVRGRARDPTGLNQAIKSPRRQIFGPNPSERSKPRAMSKAAPIQIPEPENVTISEEYGAGSIVIVNRERKLHFVEEKGKAIRYPVAIGSPADEWQGVQTITAKRENPRPSSASRNSRIS